MNFAYHAYDRAGREIAETIEAASAADAAENLRQKGLYVTRIRSSSGQAAGGPRAHRSASLGRARRLKNLVIFTRQLYVLVSSGTRIADALGALARQIQDPAWRQVIQDVRTQVDGGKSLSEAMQSHPECFDSIYRSLVAAGESSGKLSAMLNRLGTLAQKRLQIRNAVVGALVYPTLLLVLAGGVLGLLLVFVVPRFAELFRSLDVPLPPSTQLLVDLSVFLRSWWWGVLAAGVGGAVAVKCWLRTARGRRAKDTLLLRLPQVGRITRSFITARIARLLGLLLEGRVPVVEALRLTRESAGNSHYAELVASAEDAVVRGQTISSAFAASDLVSPSLCEAIRSGEQSGQVGSLLLEMADFMDQDNEIIVRSLMSILEPVILVLLGVLVGFVAVSLFTPLFDVTAMTQGGGA